MENTTNENTTNTGLSAEDKAFDNKINNLGRFTSIIALAAMFAVPLVITLVNKVELNFGEILSNASGLIALFAPTAIVENISYYAIIGAGGVYLSCITGNIMNMKLPCALSGMKIANVEPGSKKGDIISIISIGMSSIVTTIILFLGMVIIGQLLKPILEQPILQPGFDNIMPALMGAVAVPFVLKSGKVAAAPVVLSLVLYILVPDFMKKYQSYMLAAMMLVSVGAAYFMHKKGMLDKNN